jgi:ABC-type branched-subunit amino acid transport system ATPase component
LKEKENEKEKTRFCFSIFPVLSRKEKTQAPYLSRPHP